MYQVNNNHELQFEAAWALTNIASTQYTKVIVDAGVPALMVKLLRSINPDIREQCIWCLGNIAGDATSFRDLILSIPDSLDALLCNIVQPHTPSLLRNATWTLSNFCRGKPHVSINSVRQALPVILSLLANEDAEVVADATWAISYLSDGSDERIQSVVDNNLGPALIKLLQV